MLDLLPAFDDAEAEAPQLVPLPLSLSVSAGRFELSGATTIAAQASSEAAQDVGRLLAAVLARGLGREPGQELVVGSAALRDTILLTTAGADPALGAEGYTLDVTSSSIVVRAPHAAGLFRGTQTLRQLLPTHFEGSTPSGAAPGRAALPLVSIRDKPRYSWRGLLLDCSRSFMSVETIKDTIDLLAYQRMNVLHWHLLDDQGWRLQIERFPKLTDVGAWSGTGAERSGGFYTRDDVREIVAYAARRFITVVPEISMPGHSVAALAAYPVLSCTDEPLAVSTRSGVHEDVYCAGKESTFEFLAGVLQETLELFPSEFIHLGGEAVPTTRWQDCPDCQQRMIDEELADEAELQGWFLGRVGQWLGERGRRWVGGDDILQGGPEESAVVQSFAGPSAVVQAVRSGHDVIASPTSHCSLDAAHDVLSLETVYAFEPTPAGLSDAEAAQVLGAEGVLWTGNVPQERVEAMVWARLSALAEVTWSPADQRSYYDFYGRMRSQYKRFDALGVDYYVAPPTVAPQQGVFVDALEIRFHNPVGRGVVRYTLDGSEPTAESELFADHPILWRDTVVQAAVFLENGRRGDVARWVFEQQQQQPQQGAILPEPIRLRSQEH